MDIKPFSEDISTGQIQGGTKSAFQDTEATEKLTRFETQTKTFLKHYGNLHPGGIKKFVDGLDRGLKSGYRPRELEILFRTWFHNSELLGDPRQKELLPKIWPGLKNKIDLVAPPWKGNTIYERGTPPHPEGVSKNVYGEYYHKDVGWY